MKRVGSEKVGMTSSESIKYTSSWDFKCLLGHFGEAV